MMMMMMMMLSETPPNEDDHASKTPPNEDADVTHGGNRTFSGNMQMIIHDVMLKSKIHLIKQELHSECRPYHQLNPSFAQRDFSKTLNTLRSTKRSL
jgi:hypothetical protein